MVLSKVFGAIFQVRYTVLALIHALLTSIGFVPPQTQSLPLLSHYRSLFRTLVVPYAPPRIHYYCFLSSHTWYNRLLFIVYIWDLAIC